MPRAHRRRREKKLMTMDEVNDRFPLTKYKTWISSRAEQGLSTAGGVAAPPSRAASIKAASIKAASVKAASVKGADGVIPPYQDMSSEDDVKHTSAASSAVQPHAEKSGASDTATAVEKHKEHEHHEHDAKTSNSTITPANESRDADEDMEDDDDQIQMAVPTEMLENPGDS
ncbi:MAG: hypothetical protein Q9187_007212, partial [Circinaria calcarea]